MWDMETVGAVLAALLPFVVLGLGFHFVWRWWKRRRQPPIPTTAEQGLKLAGAAFVVTILLVTVAVSGWRGGWSLESLLMPLGWVVSGLALFLLDRFLDHRLRGRRPKVAGPIPFWWVFVWALALGWGAGIVSAQGSTRPTWLNVLVLVVLLLAAVVAFCFRFGLRLSR